MAKKIGIKCRAYRNTGTYAVPVWSHVDILSDVTINKSKNKAPAGSRQTRVDETLTTTYAVTVGAKAKVSDANAHYLAIYNAWAHDTTLDLMFLNGDVADEGVRGVRFHADVTTATEDQSMGAALYDDLEFSPSADREDDEPPTYVVVGASAAVDFNPFGEPPPPPPP